MRGRQGHIKTLFAGMITLSLFATMLMAFLPGNVSASPSWQVGDKWALAGEKDIGQVWDSLAPMILSGSTSGPPINMTITGTSFHGKIVMDSLFEVTGVTASEITLQIKVAANLTIAASATINGNFPAPGTYNSSLSQSPVYTNRNIVIGGQLVAATSGTLTAKLNASTMAIKSFDVTVNSYMKGYIAVTNFPSTTYDHAYTAMTISYSNFNSSVDVHMSNTMHAVVSPAIEVLSDSMIVGEIKDATASVTASETISGSANMGGLPTSITSQYFNANSARAGVTGFPINLAKIYNPDSGGMPINNGTIASSTGTMSTHIAYVRNTNVDDAVTGSVAAREYALNQGGSTDVFTFLLDSNNGHALGSTSTIPMGGDTQVIFTTHAVGAGSAQTSISAMDKQVSERQSYATVTGTGGAASAGPISSDMLIIIVVIVIVVIAVVAGVVVMRRKK